MKKINKVMHNTELVVNVDVESIEGEKMEFAIVFDVDEERMFYLNSTSYEIYKIADVPLSETDIVNHFKSIYSLDDSDLSYLKNAISDMLDKNILISIE